VGFAHDTWIASRISCVELAHLACPSDSVTSRGRLTGTISPATSGPPPATRPVQNYRSHPENRQNRLPETHITGRLMLSDVIRRSSPRQLGRVPEPHFSKFPADRRQHTEDEYQSSFAFMLTQSGSRTLTHTASATATFSMTTPLGRSVTQSVCTRSHP
jgi:hypothetical protein